MQKEEKKERGEEGVKKKSEKRARVHLAVQNSEDEDVLDLPVKIQHS